MNKQIKRFCAMAIITLFIYSFYPILHARIAANWRECTNEPGCISGFLVPELKSYILESTGYFLKSHSDYQAFLNLVELAETNCVNYIELKETLYLTIENIEKAKTAYTNLKTASDKIPLNQAMIDQLMKFNYDEFQAKYGLIEPIFNKVKALLSKGDIHGFDAAMLVNMTNILSKLYELKIAVDKGQMPEIAILWRTNQAYTEAQLFGQYMSEVFKDILF